MNKNIVIGVMADDLRQIYMTKYLIDKGYRINLMCSNNLDTFKEDIYSILDNLASILNTPQDMYDFIDKSDIIVAPIPFIKVHKFMNIVDFIVDVFIPIALARLTARIRKYADCAKTVAMIIPTIIKRIGLFTLNSIVNSCSD